MRKQKFKVRKFMGAVKDRLIGKAKAAHTSKEKSALHSPLPKGRQFSNIQETWAPSFITVTWQDKQHHSKCVPLFLFLHPAFIAECDALWSGTTCWAAGVSSPGSVPSQLLGHSQTTRGWCEKGKRP